MKKAALIIIAITLSITACKDPASPGPVITGAPTITTASLPNGTVGTAYSQTLSATGDTPITWSIPTGTLPASLTLNTNTGAISGTPSTDGTSSFTVKATNSVGEKTKTLSITISKSGTPPYDFTKSADYQKLGLVNNTVYGTVTFNGTNVINAMEQRWALAQNKSDASTQFYPVSTNPTVTSITVDGVTNLNGVGIYGASPKMIFIIKGSKLTVWGMNETNPDTISISFDIAVIENSSGKGWLNQSLSETKTEYYPDNSDGHEISFTLSNLTGGTVTSLSNYSTYSVYIIVRGTSLRSTLNDFNTSALAERNVIKPEIK